MRWLLAALLALPTCSPGDGQIQDLGQHSGEARFEVVSAQVIGGWRYARGVVMLRDKKTGLCYVAIEGCGVAIEPTLEGKVETENH